MSVDQKKVISLISQASRKPAESITPEKSFRGDLKMDSLQSLDLLVLLEEEMQIVIPQTDAVKIQTVQNLFDYLKK